MSLAAGQAELVAPIASMLDAVLAAAPATVTGAEGRVTDERTHEDHRIAPFPPRATKKGAQTII